MSDFDPVEIRLDLIQNVDSEGEKAEKGINEIAAASDKMRQQFEKDIAAQKNLTTQLINELKLLKETMGKKVETGDDKQIVDKQKLAEQIDLLNKKLIEQEALLNRISKTPATSPLPKLSNQVGDYARQVNGLKFSMTQISRELPNFAISPMIGIMSLSNNLPMLQGDITRMIELNKQLKASGQATIPVFKQLFSSLFSWQTLLIAGISALMLWGPAIGTWVGGLFKAKDALKMTKDEVKGLTESLAKNIGSEAGQLNQLFDALKKAQKGTSEYNDAKSKIIDQYGKYLSGLDGEITSLENIEGAYHAITQAIYEKARAETITSFLKDAYDKKEQTRLNQYQVIRDGLIKYSPDQAEGIFENFRNEFERTGKIGEITQAIFEKADATLYATSPNPKIVTGALDEINKAQDEFNAKSKDSSILLGDLVGGEKKVNDSLVEQAELRLKMAKLMPDATSEQLTAKNKEIEAAENELEKLKTQGKTNKKATEGSDKEKNDRTMIEISKEYLDLQDQIIQKEKELTRAILSGDTDLGLKLDLDIYLLQKKLNDMVETPTIAPIKAKLATTPVDTKTLGAMKQLTAEQLKQLEILSKTLTLDGIKNDPEKLEEEAKLREEITKAALQLVDALRQGMDLTEGQAAALDGAMNTISQLGQGDYIGAAISGITTAVGAIMDTSGIEDKLSRPWEEFEDWISRSNDALERYIKLRDEAIGSERYTTSDKAIKEAQDIKTEAESKLNDMKLSWTFKDSGWFNDPYKNIDRAIDDLQNKLGGGLKMEGDEKEWGIAGAWKRVKQVVSYDLSQMTKDAEGNFSLDKLRQLIKDGTVADEAVIQAVKDYDANMDTLINLQKEKQQLLTDTMASSIADSIIEGFKNGYDSAADFADNFEGLMEDAVLNAVKIKALEEPLKKWYDQFSLDMESGAGLDENEKSILKKWWDDIVASGIAASDAALDAAGIDTSSSTDRTGSTKGIAQASQDSVDELNGRMTAIQAYIYDIRNINQQSFDFEKESAAYDAAILSQLETIAENTDYCKLLVDVKRVLEDIQLKGVKIKS